MPLLYHPRAGEIVICHYDPQARPPEMTKTRPVVIVGPKLRRRAGLAMVVPLSTTEPVPLLTYHYRIVLADPLPPPFDTPIMWAKCDMVSSVALSRLDRFKLPRARYGGPRAWTSGFVDEPQLAAIRHAILCGLGLES